ncbi:hypothetical protein [Shinella kummerowiae]|uniref:hypothetical protein n=1 Tax=Shinella kummerowiae TaxID=417745 RepID=UPI0021B62B1B|nr:hypothetical protein [Shinella kummerowiae]MCT7665496.1 hypothetical protein [Shinella kummerowiae]
MQLLLKIATSIGCEMVEPRGFRSIFKSAGVIATGVVGAIGVLAAVLANIGAIKATIDAFLSPGSSKVTLLHSRLIFESSNIPIPRDVPGIYFSDSFDPTEGVPDGETVVDLHAIKVGDALNHVKFAEVSELARLVVAGRLKKSDLRFVFINEAELSSFTLAKIRILVQKDTAPALENCGVKVYQPDGEIKEAYNFVELPSGTWKNYFEFGLVLDRKLKNLNKITSKWEVVLSCSANGGTAGDGPVLLTVTS